MRVHLATCHTKSHLPLSHLFLHMPLFDKMPCEKTPDVWRFLKKTHHTYLSEECWIFSTVILSITSSWSSPPFFGRFFIVISPNGCVESRCPWCVQFHHELPNPPGVDLESSDKLTCLDRNSSFQIYIYMYV